MVKMVASPSLRSKREDVDVDDLLAKEERGSLSEVKWMVARFLTEKVFGCCTYSA